MDVLNSAEELLGSLMRSGHCYKHETARLSEWYRQIRGEVTQRLPDELVSLYGGFFANNVAQAFINGYESAIQRLTACETGEKLAALCVTENKRTHPKSILTQLASGPDGQFTLSGKKDFVTMAEESQCLFVAARVSMSEQGRPDLKMVRVDASAPGVKVKPLPALPFVPEVSHGIVVFDSVVVAPGDVLVGDGYSDYVKPFRWFEDLNVFTSVAAYLLKLALSCDWPVAAKAEMTSLLSGLAGIQAMRLDDPVAHVVMADQFSRLQRWLDRYDEYWTKVPANISNSWRRDRGLLNIADSARKARYEKALSLLF